MITVSGLDEMRHRADEVRRGGGTVGLVPTMGSLHEGHRSLMRAARAQHDLVIVSLFVNPTQFGPGEDLDAYPRDLAHDAAVATAEGVDVLFAPTATAMYPATPRTSVHVEGLTTGLCGASRPTHFDGVALVVTKLFSIVGPCSAYFGRKDAQQLAVIRQLVEDLNLPVDVVGCPLVREADGVALSSRNAYLDEDGRRAARVLSRSLRAAAHAVETGQRDPATLRDAVAHAVAAEPGVTLDYAELVDGRTMEPARVVDGPLLLAVAAFVGATRLIDNLSLTVTAAGVETDLGVVVQEHT